MFILTYDAKGDIICSQVVISGGDDQNSICVDKNGNAYVEGDLTGPNPVILGTDTFIDALEQGTAEVHFIAKFMCSVETGISNTLAQNYALQIYPNPFGNQATANYSLSPETKSASLIVYDLLGRQRETYKLLNTETRGTINARNLSAGIYFYSLVADGPDGYRQVLDTKKMVVE